MDLFSFFQNKKDVIASLFVFVFFSFFFFFFFLFSFCFCFSFSFFFLFSSFFVYMHAFMRILRVFCSKIINIFFFFFFFLFLFSFCFCFLFLFLFFIFIFLFYFFLVFYPRRVILKEPRVGTHLWCGPAHTYTRENTTPTGVPARAFYIYMCKILRSAVQQVVPTRKKVLWGGHEKVTKLWKSKCKRYLGPLFLLSMIFSTPLFFL